MSIRDQVDWDDLKRSYGVNSFALLFKDGALKQYSGEACLGSLGNDSNREVEEFLDWPFGELDGNLSGHDENYLDWLSNESYWKDAFLTKSSSEMVKDGILYDVNLPSRHVVQAAVCARYPNDYRNTFTNRFSFWEKYFPRKEGLAFYLAHHTAVHDKDGTVMLHYDNTDNNHHQVLDKRLDRMQLTTIYTRQGPRLDVPFKKWRCHNGYTNFFPGWYPGELPTIPEFATIPFSVFNHTRETKGMPFNQVKGWVTQFMEANKWRLN